MSTGRYGSLWAGTKEGIGEVAIQRGAPLYQQVAAELRRQITTGRYAPGDELPSERELGERFKVSGGVVRSALVQLRAEGLVVTYQGKRPVVLEPPGLRRLSTDISEARGFYTLLERAGRAPATQTTVTRGPASAEVAEALGVEPGNEVVIRARVLRAEGGPPIGTAVSFFPPWVVDAAPALGDPEVSGLPVHLREAFGPTYSEDLIDCRMPTAEEREVLEIPPGVPVLIIKGNTRDQHHRVLHFIDKVTVAGRMSYGYKFGDVPAETA
jgi:GntR family transcriptional regulator